MLPYRNKEVFWKIGAGKGIFIKHFSQAFPLWNITALDPNRTALSTLIRRVPQARTYASDFAKSPFIEERYDLVVLIGVLEHIADPVRFLRSVRACLRQDGMAMISVPNFLHNPADLLTYDHLTRFTPDSLRRGIECAGLRGGLEKGGERVPMWILAHAGPTIAPVVQPIEQQTALRQARIAADWIGGSLDVFDRIGKELSRNRRLAVYGTGTIAIAASKLTRLSQGQIICFIDDNALLHGSTRLERPIVGMRDAIDMGISDVTFSANPCYLTVMEKKG